MSFGSLRFFTPKIYSLKYGLTDLENWVEANKSGWIKLRMGYFLQLFFFFKVLISPLGKLVAVSSASESVNRIGF